MPAGAALPDAVEAGGVTGGANGAAGPPPKPALSPREKSDEVAGEDNGADGAPAPPGRPPLPKPPGDPKPCVGSPPPLPRPLGVDGILGNPPPPGEPTDEIAGDPPLLLLAGSDVGAGIPLVGERESLRASPGDSAPPGCPA
ncbi:hypothetical protein MAHJHV58_40330 [Mycobacterium avium subsp. hominissuis]